MISENAAMRLYETQEKRRLRAVPLPDVRLQWAEAGILLHRPSRMAVPKGKFYGK